jgi:hypothetical protein
MPRRGLAIRERNRQGAEFGGAAVGDHDAEGGGGGDQVDRFGDHEGIGGVEGDGGSVSGGGEVAAVGGALGDEDVEVAALEIGGLDGDGQDAAVEFGGERDGVAVEGAGESVAEVGVALRERGRASPGL